MTQSNGAAPTGAEKVKWKTWQERENQLPVWDMSQERAFMENLLNQRFNFFLVFSSLVIAGSLNAKEQRHLQLVLTVGAVVCSLLMLTLLVAQCKLDIILGLLEGDESHPYGIVKRLAQMPSARRIVGYIIPVLISLVLIVASACAWTGCLKVPNGISH
jgi:hypothetical protein